MADYGRDVGPAVDPLNGQLTDSAGGSQSHTHNMTNVSSGSASSLPSYYTLSLVMRCA